MTHARISHAPFKEIADGIFCIETGLYRHGLAACYLLRSGDRLAFVDTGTAKTFPGLLGVIEALGLTPAHVDFVMPTHVHLDHAGGSGNLMRACPSARLVVHPKGAPHMIDPSKLIAGATAVYGEEGFAKDFGELVPVPEDRVILAEDGQTFDLNGRLLTFLDTPGHANHHGCIFDAQTKGFFTGDTFGIAYREFDTPKGPWLFAPTTPVAFDPESWQSSLDKLMAYEPEAMYLTHFGRVDRPARLVDDLRQSIRNLAELALAEEGKADDQRQTRLKAAVTDHLTESARACGVDLEDTHIQELLAVDTELNAQGLEVWLRRREKRAAS
ncbi:MBL fold metallo-hydrolase [Thiorhodococcus minor]|uniref:MBL fold metallo-hydrolase n=1 Tax=Thiorhodococcus minor TaxID=57489 RepID=A0A6M0K1N3_9GAMM|nr:MBL fold metallo-hydrolase [Thiorhodococcus minor]NEV62235.1 MBL fold metallo-hydrolase [Thiorhodococcus minor]